MIILITMCRSLIFLIHFTDRNKERNIFLVILHYSTRLIEGFYLTALVFVNYRLTFHTNRAAVNSDRNKSPFKSCQNHRRNKYVHTRVRPPNFTTRLIVPSFLGQAFPLACWVPVVNRKLQLLVVGSLFVNMSSILGMIPVKL